MKHVVRKATLHEQRYVDAIRDKRGIDIYRDDWAAYQAMHDEGLIVMSPPRGMGKAWRRAVLPGMEDW